ncbi:ABC transporter [Xaviernesmea oryzae]|uniref:ABC transporter n=1 Tax=Xaviernesmea oryzae TaxID=464029 RepID=A0A1Q9B1L2_9HYPH|nr:ABC transporter permease [Xaviernesmea oryzae]OLP61898.1 ABC transporter [Xaviernesmea oryzae]SEL73883.1 osmoprotectant transport system permease protein [Xaviernesmea oryzae]
MRLRIIMLGLVVLLGVFLAQPLAFSGLFAPLTRNGAAPIYTQTPLLTLTLHHLALVAASTLAATLVSIGLAIATTRASGLAFLPLARAIANIGQTFPPVAVLALAVPIFGFGSGPTLIALFLYGLLPIFETALTGLTEIAPETRSAATASGMTAWQRLVKVELPLAWPVILSGIRLSAVIALSTATIGSTVAAATLGEVIISGLLTGNTAFVLQGAMVVAILAILINEGFLAIEAHAARRAGRPPG